jgi:hypothetical protein
MFKQILKELKNHAPFTIFGALTGIAIMLFFGKVSSRTSLNIFYTLHPMHVILSAFTTASMYNLHKSGQLKGKSRFLILLIVGYTGSVGIATISDSIIPYLGEVLLRLPNREIHLGFVERWWLINPLAIAAIIISCFKSHTKISHMGHVLVSTWASLFHIMMSLGGKIIWFEYIYIFVFLFLAVWLPCCISDIVFPLLFVRKNINVNQEN